MKRVLILLLVSVMCVCMVSCGRSVFSDKHKLFRQSEAEVDGVFHGIESYFRYPYIFIGEFTGEAVRNIDGLLYKKFHVTEKIKGDVEDDIIIKSYSLNNDRWSHDLPFTDGEKYLLMTNKEQNVYVNEYYSQGQVFCPVDAYEDSFMIVIGEYKHLDFMTTGSKKNFNNFNAFKAYLKSKIDTAGTNDRDSYYYTDSDNIRDIITESLQILKVKVLAKRDGWDKFSYSNYDCRVEKVYKGDYDLEKGKLIGRTILGKESVDKGSEGNKHVFFFKFFDADIDLEKTDEYIICTNSHSLIARKGVVSLDYTEEEIISMIEEIYGEINMIEIP